MERTVPPVYEGLWRRKAIYRSNGTIDSTTEVWWFQGPAFHIDLRVPADGKTEKKTGFAGTTYVTFNEERGEHRMEWRPEIAFPYLNKDEIDAGYMKFPDSYDKQTLQEIGVCGTYSEDWYKEGGESESIVSAMREEEAGEKSEITIQYTIETQKWKGVARGKVTDTYIGNEQDPKHWTEVSVYNKTDLNNEWTLVASTLPHWRV